MESGKITSVDNENLQKEIEKLKEQLADSQAKYQEKVLQVQNLRNEAHARATENANMLAKIKSSVEKYRHSIQHEFYEELANSLSQWSTLVAKELKLARREEEVAQKFALLQHELFVTLKNRGYRQFQQYDANKKPRRKSMLLAGSPTVHLNPASIDEDCISDSNNNHQRSDPEDVVLEANLVNTVQSERLVPDEVDQLSQTAKPTPTNIIIQDCDGVVKDVSVFVENAVTHGAALGSNPWTCNQLEARAVDAANLLDMQRERLVGQNQQPSRRQRVRYGERPSLPREASQADAAASLERSQNSSATRLGR